MKKTILALMLIASSFIASAHTIELFCWHNQVYNIHATQGASNGKIEVTTYTNSNRTTIVQGGNTVTYTLNSNGRVDFTVPQPNINTPVYVYIKWYKKQGSNYVVDNWNNGSPFSGRYTSSCHVTPILFGAIGAENVENTTLVTFQVESTDPSNQVTITYRMPDGSTKEFPITFLDKLILGDIWVVTINNKTGAYTITKKNK